MQPRQVELTNANEVYCSELFRQAINAAGSYRFKRQPLAALLVGNSAIDALSVHAQEKTVLRNLPLCGR